jgi:hypothetical protein
MRFLSAPAISRLTLTPAPMTICDRMLRGKYGKLIRRGRIPYVSLAAVERFHGLKFDKRQIELAVAGRPDWVLVIPDHPPKEEA